MPIISLRTRYLSTVSRHILAAGGLFMLLGTDAVQAGSVFDGGYVGGQVVYGVLDTDLEGPRSGGRRKLDDLSGDGASINLFGGYGSTFGRYYLGGELDASVADINWEYNDKSADGS